jgi:hypothetical protein
MRVERQEFESGDITVKVFPFENDVTAVWVVWWQHPVRKHISVPHFLVQEPEKLVVFCEAINKAIEIFNELKANETN